MFSWFGIALSFFVGNFHAFMYAATGIAAATFLWWGYNQVLQYGKDQVLIAQYQANEQKYQQELANKDQIIKLQQQATDIANQAVTDKNTIVDDLTTKYDSLITLSLGKDLESQAPDSLKELLRQLKAKGL
jgi:uncharacterized protein HemX